MSGAFGTNWLDLSSTSNRYIQSYYKGFVDISGGPLYVRNNNLFVQGGDVSLNGRLYSAGDASLNNRLFLGSDAYLNGNLSVMGNIGIGTTTPLYKIDASGAIKASQFILSSSSVFTPTVSTTSSASWVNNGITWTASSSSYYIVGGTNYPSWVAFNNTNKSGNNIKFATSGYYNNGIAVSATGTPILTTTYNGSAGPTVSGEWLQIQTSIPLVMTNFTLGSSDQYGTGQSLPKTYLIVGSNDGNTFYPIQYGYASSQYINAQLTNSSVITINYSGSQNAGLSNITTQIYAGSTTSSYNYFRIYASSLFSATNGTVFETSLWNINFSRPSGIFTIDSSLSQVNVNTNFFVGGVLNTTSDISFGGRLFSTGDLSLGGNLSLNNGTLYAAGDMNLNSRLFLVGDGSLNGNVNITGGALQINPSSVNASQTWTVLTGTNLPANAYYTGLAVSSNGNYILVPGQNTYVYLSTNGGSTWTVTPSGLPTSATFNTCNMSSSGQYMLICVQNSSAYLSTNYGSTFSSVLSVGNCYAATMSSNGQYIITTSQGGSPYFSSNYGSSFSQISSISANNGYALRACAISTNNQYMIVSGSGNLYLSSNFGSSWALISGLPTNVSYWNSASLSSTGQYMLTASYPTGSVYVSNNYGSSWTTNPTGIPSSSGWCASYVSKTGQYMFVGGGTGLLYFSTNYGVSFSSYTNLPAINSGQNSIAITPDMSKLYVTGANNPIYISTLPVTTPSSQFTISAPSTFNNGITVTSDASINGRLFVGADVSMGGKLFTVGDTSHNARLYVGSDASINGSLFVNSRTINQGDISANNRLFVGADASFGSRIFAVGDVSFNNRLFVGRDLSVNGNLNLTGNINISQTGTHSITGTLTTSTSVTATSTVTGNETVGGTETITGLLTASGGLVSGLDASLNNRLFVGSDVSLGSRLFTVGDVSFNNRLYVGLDASFGGNFYVGKNVGIAKAPAYPLDISGISRTSGAVIFGTLPTTKYYTFAGTPSTATITSPSLTFTFGNSSFYAKFHCFLSDASTNTVSTVVFDVQGGNAAGTTPSNNIAEITRVSTINGYYQWLAPTYTTTTVVLGTSANTGVVANYSVRVELIQTNAVAANLPTLNSITMVNNNSGGTVVTSFAY